MLQLFEDLANNNPEVLKKLVVVESDLSQVDLGLSKKNKQQLISEVTVVFNLAASVRMGIKMKEAITHNTANTKRLLEVCVHMKQLKVRVCINEHLKKLYKTVWNTCDPKFENLKLASISLLLT